MASNRNFNGYQQGWGVMQPNHQQPINNNARAWNVNDEQFNRVKPPSKHSGARWIAACKNKKGNPAILAWNVSRRMGMLDIFIAPYAGTVQKTSASGREWSVWMCTIQGKGIDTHFPVFVDTARRMAVIRNGWNWVVNCNAPNKGYCAQYNRK